MKTYDQKLIKKTNKKLVISGDFIELYTFERPLFYNFSQESQERIEREVQSEERRFSSIKRSRDQIRRLCNANCFFYSDHRPKFLTLTFRDNITDLKQARKYYRLFNQKLQYRYPDTKYLGVPEIQNKRYEKYGHKVWHFHIIYFNLPFRKHGIEDMFKEIWPHGFIKFITLSHVKNVGAYVSKYLRKDLYEPALFAEKSYFCSKGLVKPNELREPKNVNNFLRSYKNEVQYEQVYESNTHGQITYQVIKLDYANSSR
jgi:hypothetical protein